MAVPAGDPFAVASGHPASSSSDICAIAVGKADISTLSSVAPYELRERAEPPYSLPRVTEWQHIPRPRSEHLGG